MVQQVGRARNLEAIDVLYTTIGYENRANKYISFEDSVKEEDRLLEEYEYKIATKYDNKEKCAKDTRMEILKEMGCMIVDEMGNIKVDSNKIFSKIHYYRSYYEKLFGYNKAQLFIKFCEEQGFNIEYKTISLNIEDAIFKNSCTDFKKELNQYMLDFLDKDKELEDREYKYLKTDDIFPQVNTLIQRRLKLVDSEADEVWRDSRLMGIIADNDRFEKLMRSLPLFYKTKTLNDNELNSYYNDFPEIRKNNKIYDRLVLIRWLENELAINRFDVAGIDLDDEGIKEFKKKLIDNKKLLECLPLPDGKDKKEEQINKKLNGIKFKDHIQKFVAECYNLFDDFIRYKSRVMRKDGVQRTYYDGFQSINERLMDYVCFFYHRHNDGSNLIGDVKVKIKKYYKEVIMFDK